MNLSRSWGCPCWKQSNTLVESEAEAEAEVVSQSKLKQNGENILQEKGLAGIRKTSSDHLRFKGL